MPVVESRLKNGLLTLGGTEFKTQAANVTLSPDIKESGDSLEVLSGDIYLPTEATSWALNITAVQDFTAPAGFVNYCMTQAGNTVSFSWKPNATGPTYAGTCKIRPVEIGGDVNSRLTTAAEFPVVTGPTPTYPA